MRKVPLFIVFLFLHTAAFCQNKHSIFILLNNFRFSKTPIPGFPQKRELLLSYPGIYYNYKPFDKWGFYVSYNFWSGNLAFQREPSLMVAGIYDENINKVYKRKAYKFVGISVTYKFFIEKRHRLYANTGLTLAFGKDIYLDRINWTTGPHDPLRDFAGIFTHEKKAQYLGVAFGCNYHYYINKNFTIGCNIAS